MAKRILFLSLSVLYFVSFFYVAQAQEILTRGQIVDFALKAAEEQGYELVDFSIVYDEANRRWSEVMLLVDKEKAQNKGIFEGGYMDKYQAVLIDFTDPQAKDVWVFVDRESGDILTFFEE